MKKLWEAFPKSFLDRIETLLPQPNKRAEILANMVKRRPTTLRVNTLKSTKEELINLFTTYHIPFEPVSWYSDAFVLGDYPLIKLTKLPFYEEGKCYVQGISSMIPALVLDPKPGEKILDIAAAPGSKTTQLASLMHNNGQIVANDTSRIRTYKLQANLNRQGVTIVNTTQQAAQSIWRSYPEQFDHVLADVPCSMEGRFLASEQKTFTDWTPKKVKLLASQQCWMLRSALSACKVGGSVVYSTCTLSPEENEGVVDWLLRKEKEAITIEKIDTSIVEVSNGIVSWKEKTFHSMLTNTIRIYPNPIMEGFFIAKIRKVKKTVNGASF